MVVGGSTRPHMQRHQRMAGSSDDAALRRGRLLACAARPMRRVVVFDLDDTLFPEWQYVLSGFRAVDTWLRDTKGLIGFYDHAKALFDVRSRGPIFDLVLATLGCSADNTFTNAL